MSTKQFSVEVTREGDAWLADVTNLPGAHTYARSYSALHRNVDEVIRLVANLDDEQVFGVTYRFGDFDPQFARLAEIGERRAALEEANRELVLETIQAVVFLRDRYSVRDLAKAVGLTPGRISQILTANSSPPAVPTAKIVEEFAPAHDGAA
ncbi:hypothetical protein AX769_00670 [Frondihabitans sp. PAMC 28766]|uniref:hypothetical protein n=1 Tax=Frondihabitans sp. PAMC 28766 TaxID=1795630 RepID=UPI00078E86A6|nr:hypothetical protein [Frondihabitans sp. PAMC 28766]AMM18921.1 hypothetical protein AX769_00670 [Frondihabitans sp. PAMC 28766]